MKEIKTVKTEKNQVKKNPQLQPLEIAELDKVCGGFLDRNYLRRKSAHMSTKNKKKE